MFDTKKTGNGNSGAAKNRPPAQSQKEKTNLDNLMPGDLDNDETLKDVFEQLENANDEDLTTLTQPLNFLKLDQFKEGEKRGYMFMGMTETKNPETGEDQPAVSLMDKNREEFVSNATVIVNTLSKVDKIPCPVLITVNGKKKAKTGGGSYYDCQISVLASK